MTPGLDLNPCTVAMMFCASVTGIYAKCGHTWILDEESELLNDNIHQAIRMRLDDLDVVVVYDARQRAWLTQF